MKRFVLDASVALAWVVDSNPDPYAGQIRQRIQFGEQAVVPGLWQLEIVNVLAIVERRGVLNASELEVGLRYFENFIAKHAEVSVTLPPMRENLRLARELSLTSYDALYIGLAQREGLPLATLDKALRAAAAKAGVKLA